MFVGHGVYLKTSIMSHSCIANTKTIMNEDLTVDVRAVTAIKRGTEITKSYVSSMEPTQVHIYIYSIHTSTYLLRCARRSWRLAGISGASVSAAPILSRLSPSSARWPA